MAFSFSKLITVAESYCCPWRGVAPFLHLPLQCPCAQGLRRHLDACDFSELRYTYYFWKYVLRVRKYVSLTEVKFLFRHFMV